ncbi:DUF4403 family protein [Sulfitobacter pacificus]|uniref:DUF4403 family protein n=1 Tax=Sulfitobacter pacificus TaxID=1499314 RepID=UPI00333F01DC
MLIRAFTLSTFLAVSPCAADTVQSYLAAPGSHALVTLEVPYVLLQGLVQQGLASEYSGTRSDPTDALRDDTLTWRATPSDVQIVGQNGQIVVSGSASGSARVRGEFGFSFLSQSVSVSADLGVSVSIFMEPVLNADWSIMANLRTESRLTEADLYGLSIRGELKPAMDRAIARELANVSEMLANPEFMKSQMRELWTDLCEASRGESALGFMPSDVAATQPLVGPDALRIQVIISGLLVAPDNSTECPALPEEITLLER